MKKSGGVQANREEKIITRIREKEMDGSKEGEKAFWGVKELETKEDTY
jgi:hypothetical protein